MSDAFRENNKPFESARFSYKDKWLTYKKFRFTDFLIILLCLSSAAASIYLFRNDLFRTLTSYDERKPIGTISIKDNNVQRRMGDRVLWGRLAVESPLYLEDLVRVAELSAATLNIAGNHIDLGENTLIRVQQDSLNEGSFQIELQQGDMDIATGGSGTGITLKVMGKQVRVEPGTVLNAAAGEDGLVVQVSEGNVTITDIETEDNEPIELSTGTMYAADSEGAEKFDPAVVVMKPRPNARYLKSAPGLIDVAFDFNKINLDADDSLCLEISGDRNYSNIVNRIDNVENNTHTGLGEGNWYWRISYTNKVLSTGQITVTNSAGPALITPADDQVYYYQTEIPQLHFRWEEVAEAVSYIMEACETADFLNPAITKQTSITAFSDSSLGKGTWYWRVKPVFLSVYEGSAAFSSPASFRIEQSELVIEPVWPEPAVPEPIVVEEIPPPPVVAAPPPPPPVILPPPLLSSPGNRLPPDGFSIGIEELQKSRSIDFKWSAVPGANAYIFALYREDDTGRQEIIRRPPVNSTTWTLDNIAQLERGAYIWQVEAVNRGSNGTIGRRGVVTENSFTLDIPVPDAPTVQVEQAPNED